MAGQIDKELTLEDFLPYRLAILSHGISSQLAGLYDKRFGLTNSEWRVLTIVKQFPGLSAVEIAERTQLGKVAVSRAVTKLVGAKLIKCIFADTDRRRSILNLSEEGQKVHQDIEPLALAMEEDLLRGLNEVEIQTLNKAIEQLLIKAKSIGKPSERE